MILTLSGPNDACLPTNAGASLANTHFIFSTLVNPYTKGTFFLVLAFSCLRSDCLTCRFIRLLLHTHEAFEKTKPTHVAKLIINL